MFLNLIPTIVIDNFFVLLATDEMISSCTILKLSIFLINTLSSSIFNWILNETTFLMNITSYYCVFGNIGFSHLFFSNAAMLIYF